MATNWLRLTNFKSLNRCSAYAGVPKSLYCTTNAENEATKSQKSGYAEFEEKQTQLINKPEKSPESFVSLLRNSKFIAMGDPVGKIVVGEIYHVVGQDLYIDFGWKFPTVCTISERNKEFYVVGTKVKLRIKDLELSTKFLGGEEEITLHEADCVLLGLLERPGKPRDKWESPRTPEPPEDERTDSMGLEPSKPRGGHLTVHKGREESESAHPRGGIYAPTPPPRV